MVVAPGAYDCLTATRIEGEGIPAAYMTGGGTAVTRVGTPDLGFTTLTEMLASVSAITSTISVPLIADADTGYSGPFNAYRTVQEYEKAGVAVLHIEDQAFPKRCGHFDGKAVILVADMVAKIHAACDARRDDDFVLIVRTDALAVTGLDDTLRRCVAYAQAGADVRYLEALRHQDNIDRVRRELQALGCKIISFPNSLMLSVCILAQRVWREIREHGTTTNLLGDMWACRTSSRARACKSSSPWTPGGRDKLRNLHDDIHLHPAAHRLKLGSPVCTLGRMVALPGVGDKDVSCMGCSIQPSRAESWIQGR